MPPFMPQPVRTTAAPSTAAGAAPGKTSQNELQKTFIAMIFAFVISVVAQQISELLVVMTSNWKDATAPGQIYENIHDHIPELLAIATHSILSLLMISISWVMWSRSQAAGHLEDIKEVFSIKFITFLIEVFLVTLYYSLSKSIEGDFSKYSKDNVISEYITPVSVRPEAFQMLLIFLTFAIWDVIVDVIKSPKTPKPLGFERVTSFFTGIIVYCAVSLLCATGAMLVLILSPKFEQPIHAVVGDISLICVLLLFNQSKVLEHLLCKVFPSEKSRHNTKRTPTTSNTIRIVLLLLVYTATITFLAQSCSQI